MGIKFASPFMVRTTAGHALILHHAYPDEPKRMLRARPAEAPPARPRASRALEETARRVTEPTALPEDRVRVDQPGYRQVSAKAWLLIGVFVGVGLACAFAAHYGAGMDYRTVAYGAWTAALVTWGIAR